MRVKTFHSCFVVEFCRVLIEMWKIEVEVLKIGISLGVLLTRFMKLTDLIICIIGCGRWCERMMPWQTMTVVI
jgi:hypothetical protein